MSRCFHFNLNILLPSVETVASHTCCLYEDRVYLEHHPSEESWMNGGFRVLFSCKHNVASAECTTLCRVSV